MVSLPHQKRSAQTENDACFGGVVGGHFHFHSISNYQSDESFAHFARNMSEHFVSARKGYLEHGASKYRGDGTLDFDDFVFTVVVFLVAEAILMAISTASTASSSWSFWSSCDNVLLC